LEGATAPMKPKRSRRSWPDDEKQRIVAEALSPGASIADVARRHGINANLLFNWVRSMRGVCASKAGGQAAIASALVLDSTPPASSCDFIPLGVFADAPDGNPALLANAAPAETVKPSSGQQPPATDRSGTRAGQIEIELANGTRLRVDAFVNERALHRVMSALKAAS